MDPVEPQGQNQHVDYTASNSYFVDSGHHDRRPNVQLHLSKADLCSEMPHVTGAV